MQCIKHIFSQSIAAAIMAVVFILPVSAETSHDYPGPGELILTATVLLSAGAIDLWGHTGPVQPNESAGTLDYRINDHYGPVSRPATIAGDIIYWSAIAVPVTLYGLKAIMGPGTLRPLHVRMGLTWLQGFAAIYFTTQIFKVSVRRHRPDGEDTGSFFSGHASLSFYSAAFISGYLGDLIASETGTSAGEILLARVLPPVILYSAAGFCAWSRIRNHKHYFSDVIAGSAAGILIGNMAYYIFFPRQKSQNSSLSFFPLLLPGTSGLAVQLAF